MTPKKAITMEEIARLAQVSKPTVSRALNDSPLVNEKTRKHVLSVALKHGYAVNRNAQKLRQKHTNTIGVSIDFQSHRKNHITDPFIFELLAGVSEALGELNQDLLLCAPRHNDAATLQNIISSRGADGFIFLGQGHREQMLNEFALTRSPFVVWGAQTDSTPYCVVGSDNFRGGQLVGNYFLENKRRRILFVGDPTFSEIAGRRAGLQAVLDESKQGVELKDIGLGDFSYESAYTAINRYMKTVKQPPDAVFAWSDTAAMACIRALADLGYRIPEDVSVVGYNDIPSAAYFSPPITTVRQDTFQAGQLLVEKLMQLLEGKPPASVRLNTELIVRST